MHLYYYLGEDGKRVYTLKVSGLILFYYFCREKLLRVMLLLLLILVGYLYIIMMPIARFSPDDKYSRERVTCKERYGCLLTQQPDMKL